MEEINELSGAESLQLITRMINKARNDYRDTGVSALLWGSVISIFSLLTFFNYYLHWKVLEYAWVLTFLAVIPQVIIGIREKKEKKIKGHEDSFMGGLWMSFGIAMGVMAFIEGAYGFHPSYLSIYLTLYGIPTFTVGYGKRFRPMIIGGIACWVFAILCAFTPFPWQMLYMAAAAQLAWFIPGLILRKSYLNSKKKYV